jgi:hypothetical protein
MSYLSDLKSKLTPEQYNSLIAPLMYTANEVFGGNVQDYQAQLLMPIDTAKVGIPKQLEFEPVKQQQVSDGEGGSYTQTTGGNSKTPNVIQNDDGSYSSENPINVNGVPVTATYDASGKLTGYQGDNRTTSWINGKQRIIGSWDASGRPNPSISTSRGGGIKGFVGDIMSDPVLGAAANIAAAYFGGTLGTAALGAVQGLSPEDIAKNAAISYGIGQVISGISTDPNAVGGVTGPDNIDVGGGFNPAAGATAAELAAARAALEPVVTPTISDITNEIAGPELLGEAGGNTFPLEPTISDITNEIAGPELLGEAGGNTFPLEPTQDGLTPLGDATSVSNPVHDYGDATPAEITSAKAEMAAKGLSFKDALDYVRAGLFVNAITGDPLGLSGNTGGGGGAGFAGFEQVPIPAEWKSPTYAASSAPIDLSSIFTDKNLLAGTQWQGLPQQQNVSFNDIFASGQQRTPMGQPVDINQIVSAILGQNATSQKPA